MILKKKPSQFDAYGFSKVKKEKPKEVIGYAVGASALGLILVATFELGIFAVLNGTSNITLLKELEQRFPKDQPIKNEWNAAEALEAVVQAIEHPHNKLTYPVFMDGTTFQKKVWRAVQDVPAGKTATYLEIAQKIGAPRAMRAVGSSCTRNKLFFIVPCHRIVRSGYKISGNTAGNDPIPNRDRLLQREMTGVVTIR